MDVILVDDNVSSCKILGMMLEKQGYTVHVAHDGQSGLEVIREIHPKFAVVDIALPQLNGLALVRQLKQDPKYDDVICIALTGDSAEHIRTEAVEAGFSEYFLKPIRPSTLASCLSSLSD